MDKFLSWYHSNYDYITWFIVGFLTMDCLNQITHANMLGAVISGGLAWVNYYLWKRG